MADMSLETRRNIFHMCAGMAIAALLYTRVIDVWVLIALALAGFLLSVAGRKRRVPVVDWFLSRFEREDAMESFPGRGAFFMIVGIIISVSVFPMDVAIASIVILSLGDSVAPIVGMRRGRMRHPFNPSKMAEGAVAGFAAAAAASMLFVSPAEAVIASFLAMSFESIDSFRGMRIEDNVTMPLVAGFSIMLLRAFI